MEQQKKYGSFTRELMLKELKDLFNGSEHFFVIGSEKLSAQKIESFRRILRQETARYVMVKNSLCQRLFREKSYPSIGNWVQGQTAIVFGKGDSSKIAKSIIQFAKAHETFRIKGGLLAGEVMDAESISVIASLPSRQILIAKAVGGIKAPIVGLVFTLSGILRQLVTVLDRVKEKKK